MFFDLIKKDRKRYGKQHKNNTKVNIMYSNINFDPKTHLYTVSKVNGAYNTKGPLNVGFQVTRRCNLRCTYCSEIPDGTIDMPINTIEKNFLNLRDAHVHKVNITGGEALLRKDIVDIIDLANDTGFATTLGSNATLMTRELARQLEGKLLYFESTIDGSPESHNKVRGRYDAVIDGIMEIADTGTPIVIATLLFGKSIEDAKYVLTQGHALGAEVVKYLTPIPKARGKNLSPEYLNNQFLDEIERELQRFKEEKQLSPKISIADWRRIGKGPVILLNNDSTLVGSPAIGEKDCVVPLGNLLEEPVADMWKRYPYKENHIDKYVGKTMECK